MLRLGWTDAVLRTAVLVVGVGALTACGMLGGGRESAAEGAASVATAEAPSIDQQQRYAAVLTRLKAGDAAATTELKKFSVEFPELAGPLMNLGLIRARAGDEAGARALFERASTVCTRCGSVWNQLGVLHRQQGRFADAEHAYHRAIELEPGYASAYYNLAVLYELYIPRPEQALANYERYLQMGDISGDSQDVQKWAADLRRRVNATPKTASVEGTS